MPQRKHIRILDIGCGDGVLLSRIKIGKLYGVDLDQSSLNYAARMVKAKLVRGSAESLPFRPNYFDVVVATEIIEHLLHPTKLLAEARRVLKPAGRFILTTPVKNESGLTDSLHVREFSPTEVKKLVAQYFKQVRVITSHPLWLKKIYTWKAGRLGRYQFDLGRWLVNIIVLVFGWNPFTSLPGKPTQQLMVGKK